MKQPFRKSFANIRLPLLIILLDLKVNFFGVNEVKLMSIYDFKICSPHDNKFLSIKSREWLKKDKKKNTKGGQ